MFCKNCGSPMVSGSNYCNNCGVPAGNGRNFCPNCGRPVSVVARDCPHCGNHFENQGFAPPPPPGFYPYSMGMEYRSRMVAALLAIFLGTLGIHNFYLGYTSKAITQLLLSTVGGIVTCGLSVVAVEIWSIIEAVMLFSGSIYLDGRGYPLRD